jgi:AcrR family transcriptional regulator
VPDLTRYTSTRLNPSQQRGKERIRLILDTALSLFRDQGIDQVTTNDIAEAAHIPIGSVYRYFQNKEEIIMAITTLQSEDVVVIFEEIAADPQLPDRDWRDIILRITNAWTQHARRNDSFAFIYFLRCNQELASRVQDRWTKVRGAYAAILQQRNPRIAPETIDMYIQLTWSTVEIGVNAGDKAASNAALVIAEHLDRHYA